MQKDQIPQIIPGACRQAADIRAPGACLQAKVIEGGKNRIQAAARFAGDLQSLL
jgi:hypothetical protein